MKRVFTPHFSHAAKARNDAAMLKEENARLQSVIGQLRGEVARLKEEKAAVVGRMASEAFRLKMQGPCYTGCPVMKPRAGADDQPSGGEVAATEDQPTEGEER